MTDRDLAQLVCAFRLMFPDVGLVLSTRESPKLRDGLIPLGITMMSAGSHTEPGGYTGAGKEKIHHTERGRIVELASGAERMGAASRTRDECDRAVSNCRRTFRRRSGGLDPQARLRAGVEGLGRGVDGVIRNRRLNIERSIQLSTDNNRMFGRSVLDELQDVEQVDEP